MCVYKGEQIQVKIWATQNYTGKALNKSALSRQKARTHVGEC